MSLFRLFSGLGVLGVTGVGIWFGLRIKNEKDEYKTKAAKYEQIASKARSLISENSSIKDMKLVIMDFESEKWEKRRSGLFQWKRQDIKGIIPDDVIEGDWIKFRDWCYQAIEKRQSDLSDENISTYFMSLAGGQQEDKNKLFWPYCVPEQQEIA